MNIETIEIESSSVEKTIQLGQEIGKALVGGEVIGLVGALGAGKTHLTKGIALGLGVADERLVTSPTFVLVNEYVGRVPMYHIDAYRLAGTAEMEALGFDEMCQGGGVVIVEWADRVSGVMPETSLWIELTQTGETTRRCVFTGGLIERMRGVWFGKDA